MFQPTNTAEQIRQVVRDRLVGLLAIQWPPMARQGEEAQRRELTELVTDAADLLPPRISLEAVATICDRAWTNLRRSYGGMTWPKSKTVREHVDAAVSEWRAKTPEPVATTYRPQRPTIPQPQVCQAKAEHFRKLGADLLADYWTKLGADSAIAWAAWNGRAQ